MLLTIDKDRTYSFHLRARLTLGIVACVVACVCAVIAGIFLILIQAYIALFVPVAWIGCGVAFLLLAKIHTKEYIIISPDGITLLGAKKRSNGTWIAMYNPQIKLYPFLKSNCTILRKLATAMFYSFDGFLTAVKTSTSPASGTWVSTTMPLSDVSR